MADSVSTRTARYDDPGAAPYGNFINYYTFNPPENRLSLIPQSLLEDFGYSDQCGKEILLLDVGCNSGDLTVALYRHLQHQHKRQSGSCQPVRNLHILGVDLDETLIQRAQESNPIPENISFLALDVTDDETCRTLLGGYVGRFGRRTFDVCVCLAVTMWVHMNHGDAALLKLLSRLASLSPLLLLEAQPWKCYRSAARRLRKLGRDHFEHFKELQIRGDMAEHARQHLEECCGMKLERSFGNTAWGRSLLLFSRKDKR